MATIIGMLEFMRRKSAKLEKSAEPDLIGQPWAGPLRSRPVAGSVANAEVASLVGKAVEFLNLASRLLRP